MRRIPTGFKIPKRFTTLHVVEMDGAQIAMATEGGNLYFGGRGEFPNESIGMDWMQETMERIKNDCLNKK